MPYCSSNKYFISIDGIGPANEIYFLFTSFPPSTNIGVIKLTYNYEFIPLATAEKMSPKMDPPTSPETI
jgi:hypothetical protein